MVAIPAQVNPRRAYNATLRRERARQTHEALLDAALARFLESGYAATTVDSIAEDAGVSAATIFKSYGGKPGLVHALCERALKGAGPIPAEHRSDALKQAETDPRRLIDGWGRLTAEVSPRVAPILLLLRDAASVDPLAAELHDELDRSRLKRMSLNARHLVAAGHVRPGIGLAATRDVLWLYSSPELYDLLVCRRRWTVARYSQFVADAMIAALL
jgi:AcrR family transcriptional regulator